LNPSNFYRDGCQISAASELAHTTIIAGGALTVVLTGWLMLVGCQLTVMHVLVQI